MKRPIDPSEIRVGDLVRCERGDTAAEWRVGTHWSGAADKGGTYYLLDRPKPAVELPTRPTLGWATWNEGRPVLAVWELFGPANSEDGDLRQTDSTGTRSGGNPSNILSFDRATAVPTEALDNLRGTSRRGTLGDINAAVCRFLAAVDEANGAAS